MNLRQQIIQQNVEATAQVLGVSDDLAFLRFVYSLLLNQSIHAFDSSCLVDGGQDKQIDTITIEQEEDSATIYITQMKNSLSFSSNALIQMKNGLDWLFIKLRADIATLKNVKLRDKI